MDIFFIELDFVKNADKDKIFLKKIQHKYSRLFLKNILENIYNIKADILEKNKKPYVENNPIYFSISHSKHMLGIAFDDNNIGFDIEYKKERDVESLLKYYGLDEKNFSKDDFYQMWTVYEAEYKSGFSDKIMSFNHKNYMCSVSCSNEKINKIIEISLINPIISDENIFISKKDIILKELNVSDFIILKNLDTKLN